MDKSEPKFYQPKKVANKIEKIIREVQKRASGVYNNRIKKNNFKKKEYNAFKLIIIKEVSKMYKVNYRWIEKIINAK